MRGTAFFLMILFLLHTAPVAAEGLEMVPVPEGSISKVKTTMDIKVENRGYDKIIFVALPTGWTPDASQSYVQSYAVIEERLWMIYGDPFSKNTPLGAGLVYKDKGIITGSLQQLGTRYGVRLKPNQGVKIHFVVDSLGGGGSVDPTSLETANPDLQVRWWEQEFVLTPGATGFITAPWIVKGATLIVSSPAFIADVSQKPSVVYYQDYQPTAVKIATGNVTKWDQWLPPKSPLVNILSTKSLSGLEPELEAVGAATTTAAVYTITPVWRIENLEKITYAYRWERGKVAEGITLTSATGPSFAGVPEWFDWF